MVELQKIPQHFDETLVQRLRDGEIYVSLMESNIKNDIKLIQTFADYVFPYHECNIEKSQCFYLTRKEDLGRTHNLVMTNTPQWSPSFKGKTEISFSKFLKKPASEIPTTSFILSKSVCFLLDLDKTPLEIIAAHLVKQFYYHTQYYISYNGKIENLRNDFHNMINILTLLENMKNGYNSFKGN